MPDYNQLRELCNKSSEISKTVIDEFIIYYAARRDKLEQEFETRFSRFRHACKNMPSNWVGLIKSQYIAHRIFKNQGLIPKYLKHAAIKELGIEQQNHLRQMASHPWRFSFSEIKANPATDFYEMGDIFSADSYLLYSPSTTQILSERPVVLWLNLVGFNGDCRQTFGPVAGYQCFDADDIFFYATELDPSIESESDILKSLENNPVPYIMLMTGANYPVIQNGNFEALQVIGENDSVLFEMNALKEEFRVAYSEGVFRLSDQIWSEPPHFAEAYYEEQRGIILLSALTDRGYMEMVKKLNAHRFNLPVDPDIRLHLPMVTVINDLLKRNPDLNPYSRLFEVKPSAEDDSLIPKLNELLSRSLPDINAGRQPDIDTLAKDIGIDLETARGLLQHSMDRIKELRKGS